jgi:hypothetical protein
VYFRGFVHRADALKGLRRFLPGQAGFRRVSERA